MTLPASPRVDGRTSHGGGMNQHTPRSAMPCGFELVGVKLKERLRHYRSCSDTACQERAMAWNDIVGEYRKSLARKEGATK